jgi:hypothetical protein
MSKVILNEELTRMLYLFNHERGVIVSEQKNKKPKFDWKGGTKGNVDLTNPSGVNASDVNYNGKNYNLTTITSAIRLVTKGKTSDTPPTDTPTPSFDQLKFIDDSFPYPDNMVKPKFESYPNAKAEYDKFINSIDKFIKEGNSLSDMATFTIQGTADSARPTLDVPSGYSSLDHPDTPPYGGKTNPSEMNQYLADTRAKMLGELIIKDVLDKTGKDITEKINYETGISYYGQQGKRGSEYRMVTVKPSKTSVDLKKPNTIIKTPGTPTKGETEKIPEIETFVDLRKFGGGVVPAKRLTNADIGILSSDIKDLGENVLPTFDNSGLNNNPSPEASISGDEIIVGGLSFGKFENPDEVQGVYDKRAESTTDYVSQGRPVLVAARDGYYYVRVLKFALTTLDNRLY